MHSIPYAQIGAQPPSCCICAPFSASLKTYIELNRICIAKGLTSPYRIWLLCRGLDPEGRGIVSLDLLRDAMESVGLSSRILLRVRRTSESKTFFAVYPTHVEYRSLEAVCRSLGTTPGQSVFIPSSSLSHLEEFRAALYTAWIAGHDQLMISRERISALFGISPDTQRRWERLTGVEVTFNVIEVAKQDYEAAEAHIPTDHRLDGDRLGRSYVWMYQGKYYYQSVNRYAVPHYQRGAVGNVRKVSRAVRALLPVENHGDGTGQRVFYTERTTPQRYQEKRGCSVRSKARVIDTPKSDASLWGFSQTRPVARQEVLH